MVNNMNIKRRLAEGVASWLKYEFNSYRGELFEEKYLSEKERKSGGNEGQRPIK
jgi:hypothetical protein